MYKKIVTYQLGRTGIQLSPLGLGTWQFSGKKGLGGGIWNEPSIEEIASILQRSLEGGINWIDTAEVYGAGNSEKNIAKAWKKLKEQNPKNNEPLIADKWWPVARRASQMLHSIDERLSFTERTSIDLFQIHHNTSVSSIQKQMEMMSKLFHAGKIKAVGVSNFSAKQMRKAHDSLKNEGIPLASNQVKYNLCDRNIEQNGVLETAKELGISIIAYSPLQQGLLTGRFHQNPQSLKNLNWMRRIFSDLNDTTLKNMIPLIQLLKEIGEKYDKTIAQIALNWIIHVHGEIVFAIPGATKMKHAKENMDTLSFKLTSTELELLSNWNTLGV